MKPDVQRLGGLFFIASAVAIFSAFTIGSAPELNWFDQQLKWLAQERQPFPQEDIVVVGIDDASLKSAGVPVATLHRQLGQFLGAMAQAKPQAVGLDLVLPEHSYDQLQPGLDAALARGILAMRNQAPLVVGRGANADGQLRPPHPLFANLLGTGGLGTIFVHRDKDGRVRRFDEQIGQDEQTIPTFSGQLARPLNIPVRAGLLPLQRGALLNYIPLQDVLQWESDKNLEQLQKTFGGKVVVLGSLLSHDDQHGVAVNPTRASSAATTHGVFIHAIQLRALMNDALLREIPPVWGILMAIILACTWLLRPGVSTWIGVATMVAGLLAASSYLLQAGWVIPAMTWSLALLGGLGSRTALAAWQSAAERRRLRKAFDGFVSPGVLKEILAGRLSPSLAGERRDVCVLFSDIRSFTTLSENLPPEVVSDLLNRYFERMASAIHRHGGTLDKFIGDGIMAFFGAPQPSNNAAGEAFRTAQDMLVELDQFNSEQDRRSAPRIAIGIGLHYGSAFIGYVGARARHEYSAIGDTVNTASRLEGLTKEAGYPVVMSSAVSAKLQDGATCVSLGTLPVKGRAAVEAFGWKP
jgi:adenylate cyclase